MYNVDITEKQLCLKRATRELALLALVSMHVDETIDYTVDSISVAER